MIKAVLLDLDNTLINNPDRKFAFAFLNAIEAEFVDTAGIPGAAEIFREALRSMSGERNARSTNTELIVDIFQQRTGLDTEEITTILDRFYGEHYPAFRGCVEPRHFARELIDQLSKANYAIVIATNPIYSAEAVRMRMSWGGLPLEPNRYALITSADNMHFAKPASEYYAEILAYVGIEPDEAVIIGDSPKNDIAPAAKIGIHTYQINGSSEPPQHSLQHFAEIMATADSPAYFAYQPITPEHVIPQLWGNIGALYGLLKQVKPNFWLQRPDPEEWSILQILCHLADSERNIERARIIRILEESNPFIVAPRPPGPEIPLCDVDGMTVADRFANERKTTISLLQQLTDTQWQRPARHSIFGLTTLLEMAYFTAQHDRLHLNQLCQTIGNCQ